MAKSRFPAPKPPSDVIEVLNQRIADLETERDALATRLLEVDRETEQWSPINLPFSAMCATVVDPARLIGLELEIEGKVYLVGDINPSGAGRWGNPAFLRSAVVTRARVRVAR